MKKEAGRISNLELQRKVTTRTFWLNLLYLSIKLLISSGSYNFLLPLRRRVAVHCPNRSLYWIHSYE